MGYPTARQNFESAKSKANDEAIREIAEGLIQLSRGIEEQLKKSFCCSLSGLSRDGGARGARDGV